MPSIHFVERVKNYGVANEQTGEWFTGNWRITYKTAEKLIGADVYLHSGQKTPSFIGGRIVSFRLNPTNPKRVIFHFIKLDSHEGVVTPKEGWGNEQKRIWD
jgi:hypothetical protein